MEETDVQIQLKKRARRRLVGAVVFVSFAALVLPVIMDQEPRQPLQDVEIRIPGQDEKAFAPKFAAAPVESAPPANTRPAPPPAATAAPVTPALRAQTPAAPVPAPAAANTRVLETVRDPAAEKPAERAPEKPKAEKTPDKTEVKSADRTPTDKASADKAAPEKAAKGEDAKRAAAILADKGTPAAASPARPGDYLILIGAFSNEANVRNLKDKLGQQGIRVITEALDTPQGKKTRVRAGPFPNREAAERALEKMQKIGVSGVVSAKS